MRQLAVFKICAWFCFLLNVSTELCYTQVGINTATPDASAKLDVYATDRGFLLPRLTNAQRDAVKSPTGGVIIYNATTNKVNLFNGTSWIELTDLVIASSIPSGVNTSGNIGFGTSTPHQSAILEVNATDRGILLPRMLTSAVTSPAAGLMIYNTATNSLSYYTEGVWVDLCGSVVSSTTGSGTNASGAIGIGTTTPNESALIEVSSSNTGLLIPRLTTAQRDAILSPAAGLIIYNTNGRLNYFNGTSWYELRCTAMPANGGGLFSVNSYGFSYNNLGYINLGDPAVPSGIYVRRYDPATDAWTAMSNTPYGEFYNTRSFGVIGTKQWIVVGARGSGGTCCDQKYASQYDPVTDTYTQKSTWPVGSVSGGHYYDNRLNPTAFSIGTKGYVACGSQAGIGGVQKDLWEYDTATDTWTQKANFPGNARYLCMSFVIGGMGYVGGGQDPNICCVYSSSVYADFYMYNPGTNTWTAKANIPDATYYPGSNGLCAGTGFTVGSYGYIFGGCNFINKGADNTPDNKTVYRYDPVGNSWTRLADCGGVEREQANGFVIGSTVYFGFGMRYKDNGFGSYTYTTSSCGVPYLCDFWSYTP